jgi:cellulose biosynthesis protein BcsQ
LSAREIRWKNRGTKNEDSRNRKGGVGKTTVAAVLARLYAEEGRSVLAADVDPDANLVWRRFSEEELQSISPISKMKEFVLSVREPTPRGSANSSG